MMTQPVASRGDSRPATQARHAGRSPDSRGVRATDRLRVRRPPFSRERRFQVGSGGWPPSPSTDGLSMQDTRQIAKAVSARPKTPLEGGRLILGSQGISKKNLFTRALPVAGAPLPRPGNQPFWRSGAAKSPSKPLFHAVRPKSPDRPGYLRRHIHYTYSPEYRTSRLLSSHRTRECLSQKRGKWGERGTPTVGAG